MISLAKGHNHPDVHDRTSLSNSRLAKRFDRATVLPLTATEQTLSEFAERVLFSDSLEEKLAPPGGDLADSIDARASKLVGAPAPGRPAGLIWRDRSGDARHNKLPSAPSLVDDERRGELLHFFANHELLATELMALVLLKFPDAPDGFRRDVLATLREEQLHTKWYLGRMAQCGVSLGDLPVSGYFWNSVAPMESPLDYVTRLSLTFEQANLDYARHYAEIMREAGDSRTAKILDRIYRDEIGHVGAGLKWFRRWKTEGRSDWDEFRRQLIFPLSPSRAKANGGIFNSKGRLNAGLDEEFVRSLASFERSNGRTPNVFWFHPDAERKMAADLDGRSYHARQSTELLARDLDCLMAFIARPDDVVLVRKMPSLELRERLRDWGFALPEFETLAEDGELTRESLTAERKLNQLRPWSWCAKSVTIATTLSDRANCTPPPWNSDLRELFSKAAWCRWLGGPGMVVDPGHDFTAMLADFVASQQAENVVFKSPFAASASGQKRWQTGTEVLPEKLLHWAGRVIEDQGSIVIENWRERVFDFSVQFEIDEHEIRQLGPVRLHNRESGAFVACSTGPKFGSGLDPQLTRFLMTQALPVYAANGDLAQEIFRRCRDAGYVGPLGVDAFVYRDAGDEVALREVCEINPRFTMGRLTLELRKRVSSGRWLRFAIERANSEAVPSSEVELDDQGRLKSGSVILNEGEQWQARLSILN